MRTGIDCKGREWKEVDLKTAKDLSNQTFNYLTAICRVAVPDGITSSGIWWLFQCECGNQIICRSYSVTSGSTMSCGCHRKRVNVKDLTGQRFGKLLVLERDYKLKKWKCQCDCGNITYVSTSGLDAGTSSCGCLKSFQNRVDADKYDLIGKTFGYLTVLEHVPCPDTTGKAYYKCLCDCGNETIAQAGALRSGQRCSCGKCKHRMSLGELEIKQLLDANNIKYLYDNRYFKDLIMSGGGVGRYDFILFNNDEKPYRIIEFDGRQHSDEESIYYMKQNGQRFQDVDANDKIKNEYAIQHNIPLVRIPYNKLKQITYDMLMNDDNYLVNKGE